MKQSVTRRKVLAASAVGVVLGPLMGILPAHAVVPSPTIVVAAAGSDTSENIMNAITAGYRTDFTSVTIGGVATPVIAVNIPTDPKPSPFVMQGDVGNGCPNDVNWTKDPLAPTGNTAPTLGTAPFGSTAGRNYLAAENGGTQAGNPGCIAVARASNGPRGTGGGDKSTFQDFAYAIDDVSWATTSLKAPPTLTTTQLANIYDCVAGYTDWGSPNIGGIPGPIQRYFPQPGSGTRSFFNTNVLGKSSGYTPPNVAGCPNPKFIEENQGNGGILGTSNAIADADIDKAILPYSSAVWSFQESNRSNPSLDRRKGARLGGITAGSIVASPVVWDGVGRQYLLDTAGQVTEANIAPLNVATAPFPGVRYIWNVVDTASPKYQAAVQLYGFTNTAGTTAISPTCSYSPTGTAAQQDAYFAILSGGFAPLTTADAPGLGAGHNVAGATCRLFGP